MQGPYEWVEFHSIAGSGFFALAAPSIPNDEFEALRLIGEDCSATWTDWADDQGTRHLALELVGDEVVSIRLVGEWNEEAPRHLRTAQGTGAADALVAVFQSHDALIVAASGVWSEDFDKADEVCRRDACYSGPYVVDEGLS